MKLVSLFGFLLFITACTVHERTLEVTKEAEPVPVSAIESLEGSYLVEEVESGLISGPIVINVDEDDTLQILFQNKLISENFNRTAGTHPRLSVTGVDYYETDTGVRAVVSQDTTYATSDDLEEDGTTSDLGTGKRYTVYNFELVEGRLYLDITIYDGSLSGSGSINQVVIERSFRGLK